MFEDLIWLNEPPQWSIAQNSLSVITGNRTDFWRQTFYGFIRDNGHFYYQMVHGDFTAQVTLVGDYQALYDQAGLMLRVDSRNWVKTGVEFCDGQMQLSAVITRDYSDWSMIRLSHTPEKVKFRLTRHGSAIRIQYQDENQQWRLIRLGYLDLPAVCQVGLMCCTPERAGFAVEFKDFTVTEPIAPTLHE